MADRDTASLATARTGGAVGSASSLTACSIAVRCLARCCLARCCLALCCVALWPVAALALPADLGKQEVHRVLPPAAGPMVEAGFARAAPAFRLATAELKQDRVLATVEAAGTPHRLELTDPEQGCDGTVAGPWCVRFQGVAPANAAALITALGAEKRAVWQQVTVTVGVPEGWTATGADAAVHDGHEGAVPAPSAATPEHAPDAKAGPDLAAPEQALPPAPPPITPDPSPAIADRSVVAAGLFALLLAGAFLFLWLRRGR